MRMRVPREAGSMENPKEVELDKSQVKKAVQALLAYMKTKTTKGNLLSNDTEPIDLLFTLWKIPKVAQTIRIPLPHGMRDDTDEVCLFTRDEPKMTPEQTERFYKKLLEVNGVKNVTGIIPYKVLKTEYKSFEAKRRLLGNFTFFLSDDRIRRFLPSHIGRHFYERKKEPLCVNMQSKHLARDIERLVQGTRLNVNNKGSCCLAHIGHSGMTADQLMENIEASIQTAATKIRMEGPVLKVVHLKSKRSVALPIYTADLNEMNFLLKTPQDVQKEEKAAAKREEWIKTKKNKGKRVHPVKEEEIKVDEKGVDEDEEIPQLVPIESPSKKSKLRKRPKKKKAVAEEQLEKAPRAPKAKKKTPKKPPKKMPKKAGKTDSTAKRKVPKVK